MRRPFVYVSTLALLLCACSSSTKKSGESTTASSTPSSTRTSTSAKSAPATPKLTYGTPISTIAAVIGCIDLRPSPSTSTSIDLGIKVKDEQLCTLAGQQIDITTVNDSAQQTALDVLVKGLAESFGVEFWSAEGEGWVASASSPNDDDVPAATQKKFAEQIASKTGGKVVHFVPTKSSTS